MAYQDSNQKTSEITEYNCLYTFDVRRKSKRWKDGILRFHQFNKRVMVYDIPRNFIGDSYAIHELHDGDELVLEGALVQVGELQSISSTDLSKLLAKRKPKPIQQQANNKTLSKRSRLSLDYQSAQAMSTPQSRSHKIYETSTKMPPRSSDASRGTCSNIRSIYDDHIPLLEILQSENLRSKTEPTRARSRLRLESIRAVTEQTSTEPAATTPPYIQGQPRIGVSATSSDSRRCTLVSRVEKRPTTLSRTYQCTPQQLTLRDGLPSVNAEAPPNFSTSEDDIPVLESTVMGPNRGRQMCHPLRLAGGGVRPKLVCRRNLQLNSAKVPVENVAIALKNPNRRLSETDGGKQESNTSSRSEPRVEETKITALPSISIQQSFLADKCVKPNHSTLVHPENCSTSQISAGISSIDRTLQAKYSSPDQLSTLVKPVEMQSAEIKSPPPNPMFKPMRQSRKPTLLSATDSPRNDGPWTAEAWDLLGWIPHHIKIRT